MAKYRSPQHRFLLSIGATVKHTNIVKLVVAASVFVCVGAHAQAGSDPLEDEKGFCRNMQLNVLQTPDLISMREQAPITFRLNNL
jgi:hypothetical protein